MSMHVNDNVSLLGDEQEAKLQAALLGYRSDKGTEIIVLTIASTAPETVEQYGIRAAEALRARHPTAPPAVLFVIARDNRADLSRIWIEVGRGLDAVLSESDRRRIIDEEIAPRFRLLDYYGGLTVGIERIQSLLAGQPMLERKVVLPSAAPTAEPEHARLVVIGIAVAAGLAMAAFVILRVYARRLVYLTGHRSQNRSFEPMLVGAMTGRLPARDFDDGNGFGGGFGGGDGGYAGGGGDFSGGGASGYW
jgi:uncharacterized protein